MWRHWYGLAQAWGSTTYNWTLEQILPRSRAATRTWQKLCHREDMGLPWGKPYRGRIHIWDYRPARLHPLPGGQQSPRARQGRSGLPPMSQERRWTWEVAWRTESRGRVELCAWASETGWAAWATPPDAVQAAPTAQSTYLWWYSERE